MFGETEFSFYKRFCDGVSLAIFIEKNVLLMDMNKLDNFKRRIRCTRVIEMIRVISNQQLSPLN